MSTFTEKLNAAIDEHINEIADHLLAPVALKNLRSLGKPSRELFVTGANLIRQQKGFFLPRRASRRDECLRSEALC
jgi:hypothetical protein